MTSSSYLNTYSYGDAQLNAGYNLLNLIDQTSGISGSLRKIDELWKKLAQNTTSCLGGSGACPSSVETKKQWSLDSFINPWVLKMEFYPVSSLLPTNLKLSYDIAVLNHILKQFALKIMTPFYQLYGIDDRQNTENICFRDYCTNFLGIISSYEPDWVPYTGKTRFIEDLKSCCISWVNTNTCCKRWANVPAKIECTLDAFNATAYEANRARLYKDFTDGYGKVMQFANNVKIINLATFTPILTKFNIHIKFIAGIISKADQVKFDNTGKCKLTAPGKVEVCPSNNYCWAGKDYTFYYKTIMNY
jgi:hypothetical protein